MSEEKSQAFLYEEIETATRYGIELPQIPTYIPANLSSQMEIRPYQEEALRYTFHLLEKTKTFKNDPIHLLYHMATGSGKTYMMGALILYFYQKGYRNFLFFTNQNSIIDKTINNFSNKSFSKYLFNEDIMIEGNRVAIQVVNSFRTSETNDIQLMFSTINQLHIDLNTLKETGISLRMFEKNKVVLLSDESHHFNASTKKNDLLEEETWEATINKMLNANPNNVLLEFTATCDLKNQHIASKYRNRLIYNYPLLKFREDGYTKEFFSMQSTLEPLLMVTQAMLLSQYRLKLFEKYGISNSKPVILLNSKDTKSNALFFEAFKDYIKQGLNIDTIDFLKTNATGIFIEMFNFFEQNNLTHHKLVSELKLSFSEHHLVLLDSKQNDKDEKIRLINDLENPTNPIRMIFSVSMLNEGWDVLNLFDIVRLYKTKSNPKKISATTISEAQLIGRGVRYFPFSVEEDQDPFKRKYDYQTDHELRVCETFYYHCQQDNNYIAELRNALKETGFGEERIETFTYTVKEEFLNAPIYKVGKLFKNKRVSKAREDISSLKGLKNIDTEYTAILRNIETSLTEEVFVNNEERTKVLEFKISQLYYSNYPTLMKVVRQYPALKFNHLKSLFPNLKGMEEFLTSEKYAGNFKLTIETNQNQINNLILHQGLMELCEKLVDLILNIKPEYQGTTEFEEVLLSDYIKNVKRYKNSSSEDGEGISQKDISVNEEYRLDVSEKDWFVYTDHYGTTEEKRFVKFFDKKVEELKEIYEEVYLIRNERQFHIYSISEKHNGERFEPDFILLLRKRNGEIFEQQQIFIEPKGEHLVDKDLWKQEFLNELSEKTNVLVYHDSNDYKIIGLPFYNHKNSYFLAFEKEFEKLLKK